MINGVDGHLLEGIEVFYKEGKACVLEEDDLSQNFHISIVGRVYCTMLAQW